MRIFLIGIFVFIAQWSLADSIEDTGTVSVANMAQELKVLAENRAYLLSQQLGYKVQVLDIIERSAEGQFLAFVLNADSTVCSIQFWLDSDQLVETDCVDERDS